MKLDRLAAMLDGNPGPFATALLDISRTTEDAAHQIDLRVRGARSRLEAQGAPAEAVDLVAARLAEPTDTGGPVGRLVVATAGGVVADELLPRWRGAEVVTWDPLPDVTDWLSHLDATVPVLVVLVDRVGADFRFYDAWRQEPSETTGIDGQTLHITKVPDGGRAMSSLQNRTEEVWRRNAREVAAELDRLASPDALVVLAGDERARREILDAWDQRESFRVVNAEHGSRAPGADEQTLDAEVEAAVRAAVVEDHLRQVRELQAEIGQRNRVALGIPEVIDALASGQVATVYVRPPLAAGAKVRPSDHPGLRLPDAARAAEELRADLAVLAAAAATSADAVFVGGTAVAGDGVAAVLRWRADAQPEGPKS